MVKKKRGRGGRGRGRESRGESEGAKRGKREEVEEGVEEATENINLVKNTPNNLVFKKISCNFGWKYKTANGVSIIYVVCQRRVKECLDL